MKAVFTVLFILSFCFSGAQSHGAPLSYGGVQGDADRPIKLPPDFWWGTSLSAYQSEGGNHNSWSEWELTSGHVRNNERSGLAADHWNRYETDFDNLVWLHANTHRLSIEWSRLEPSPGAWNEAAASHYRAMIRALIKRGIRPVICLFHFTLPLWAAQKGGFESDEVVKSFVQFAVRAQGAFGDLVSEWLTMNEPVVYALAAYGAGVTPPQIKDLRRVARVIAHLMRANGLVYKNLKNLNPKNSVSFAQHLRAFTPKNRFNPLDLLVTQFADQFVNWAWFDVLLTGRIKLWLPFQVDIDEPCAECLGALDYIGINYYSRDILSFNIHDKGFVEVNTGALGPKTDLNWEIYPQGLTQILEKMKARGLQKYPILLTENGLADEEDKQRAKFIYEHVSTFLKEGTRLGFKVKGYLYWSLIDNFEWIEGFTPRFGLFAVDYHTYERKPRRSAHYFREVGSSHVLNKP